jgi:nucleoid-associated protein YgaU
MISRYGNRKIVINRLTQYENLFKKRGIKQINQYTTPKLPFPTQEEFSELSVVNHLWKQGDKYYKLASEHYDDPTLWWVIAWFNQIPTETTLQPGDVILVPLPLDKILEYYDI